MVGVFHNVPGVFRAPGAQIDGVHHLAAGCGAPVGKFVEAHLVGLGGEPGQIQPLGPLLPGTHTVLPVEAGDEIAAGVAHQGHPQLFDHFDHVLAEALLIRLRVARLIDAAVNRPAQMLNEGAIEPLVHLADDEILMKNHACLFHGKSPFLNMIRNQNLSV